MIKRTTKVSVIGAGNVGSTYAFSLMTSGLAREINIIDIDMPRAEGEAMDLNHAASFVPPVKIYASGYEGCSGADLVVITAGANQKPGESRIDLMEKNTAIFKKIVPEVMKYADDPVILVVTNPVEILSYVTYKLSGLPAGKVLGSGTLLDSSRFRYLIGEHCHIDPHNVHAYIIGEHGDSELPVWSYANIGGMLFSEYCPLCNKQCNYEKKLESLFEEVKSAAYKVIDRKGATYYSIAKALVKITSAILRNEHSILPVSTLINDYYDIHDVYLSLPSVVSENGIEKFLRLDLSDQEKEAFIHSAKLLKGHMDKLI